jgi:hypothetical protein
MRPVANPLARVKVERRGRLILDGSPVTLASLTKALKALKKSNGRVRYYREGSRSEASPAALKIWTAVMDAGVPVELCDDEAALESDRFAPAPHDEIETDDYWW